MLTPLVIRDALARATRSHSRPDTEPALRWVSPQYSPAATAHGCSALNERTIALRGLPKRSPRGSSATLTGSFSYEVTRLHDVTTCGDPRSPPLHHVQRESRTPRSPRPRLGHQAPAMHSVRATIRQETMVYLGFCMSTPLG